MEKFQIFIQLTRLNKPIGFLLLFWPCTWGLTLGYYQEPDTNFYLIYLLLFFLGSVLMRSAGCIVNDIVDREFDKKVKRTKSRPIASGKITVINAIIYTVILCLFAFFILLQFLQVHNNFFKSAHKTKYKFVNYLTWAPNVGVLLVRNSKWSLDFFKNVWSLFSNIANTNP